MTWKPSCKTGSATFNQEFMALSCEVVQAFFKRVADKTFKMKKVTATEFEGKIIRGSIRASAGYSHMYLRSDVTCRWDVSSGILSISGKYGA